LCTWLRPAPRPEAQRPGVRRFGGRRPQAQYPQARYPRVRRRGEALPPLSRPPVDGTGTPADLPS
jgi:hypothetical protein